jgi:hypothetical protein
MAARPPQVLAWFLVSILALGLAGCRQVTTRSETDTPTAGQVLHVRPRRRMRPDGAGVRCGLQR